MLFRYRLVSVLCLIVSAATMSLVHADLQAEQAAIASAGAWLNLVDQGRYDDSWQQAASNFQKAVPRNQWANSLEAVRKPLGKVIARKLSSKQYTNSLPGAPDGHYVVIQFQTAFEHKKAAVETVTPMLDTDGQWRVSGYYIR